MASLLDRGWLLTHTRPVLKSPRLTQHGALVYIAVSSVVCRLAFGNEFGVAVIDIVQKVCLLNIGTPDLYGTPPLSGCCYNDYYLTGHNS